jgi:cytochrome P450
MTDQNLRDEVMTMLIAGHETVASALAWTWYLLSNAPDKEAALHDELAQILDGRPPTSANLRDLCYTDMIFSEALRLYPPAWIITRKALEDDAIGGYRIPANSLVVTSPYATHRLESLWPEPDVFRPERFMVAETAARPRFAYYPYGAGPRLCIGNNFAQVEATMVIAMVAQRFTLRLVPGQNVEVEPGVTLRPKHGLMMTLHPRSSATAGGSSELEPERIITQQKPDQLALLSGRLIARKEQG